jgi:hypothetical protein
MADRRPTATDPLLDALIELARSAERNAAKIRASRRLTIVKPSKRGGRAA